MASSRHDGSCLRGGPARTSELLRSSCLGAGLEGPARLAEAKSDPLGHRGARGVAASPLASRARWRALDAADRWEEVPSHRIEVPAGVDTIVAIGGGSAIDTGKAASAATGFPLVSVPTTYSGAEWTTFFGVRDPDRRMRGGGAGARLQAIVYEPKLTLDLPRAETVGTALNALAHSAEALYVSERTPESDRDALAGAELIGRWLPRVVEEPARSRGADRPPTRSESRRRRAGRIDARARPRARAGAGWPLRGRARGVERTHTPAGASLQRARRRRSDRTLRSAIGSDDPPARVEELARLGGFERLRDLGIPAEAPAEVAEAVAERPGARANPRSVTPADVEQLLRSIW